jgi:hypothetical protein
MKIDKKLGKYLLELLEYEASDVLKRLDEGAITEAKAKEELYWIEEAKRALGVTPRMTSSVTQRKKRQKAS